MAEKENLNPFLLNRLLIPSDFRLQLHRMSLIKNNPEIRHPKERLEMKVYTSPFIKMTAIRWW